MEAKELLNQPLLKHFRNSEMNEGESYLNAINRWEKEKAVFMDSLVEEYKKDMNKTTAANLCLQLLLIGNTANLRDHMIKCMKEALKTEYENPIVMTTEEWLMWARVMKPYIMDQFEKQEEAK